MLGFEIYLIQKSCICEGFNSGLCRRGGAGTTTTQLVCAYDTKDNIYSVKFVDRMN
jgi:hypothetical protein